MAFDGVLIHGLVNELESVLLNGRIDKIQQPETDEIHLIIRSRGNNYKLLLSASANYPRIHLTLQNKINPKSPPMFCMVLRKHLLGARVSFVKQHGMERIVIIGFEGISELRDRSEKSLIIETMGRHSNIILLDSDGIIIDAVKHVGHNISRVREVLPGRKYYYPPSQDKVNPLDIEALSVKQLIQSSKDESSLANLLTKSYTGISKVTANEICFRGNGKTSEVANAFERFFQQVSGNSFQPHLLIDNTDKPVDVLPMPYTMYQASRLKAYSTFSEALDEFFLARDKKERLMQRTAHLHKVIKNNLARCLKKMEIQRRELEKAKDAEQHRLFGELITSNIHQIPAGAKQVTLLNYYSSDNSMITIPIDPAKTPAQNAQYYFKIYNKYRRVQETQSKFLLETQKELDYLEGISHNLTMTTDDSDIAEIREELIREGYIKEKGQRKTGKKNTLVSKPHHFLSSDGLEIFVGKNNLQNDRLTLKTAMPNDLWLHTKDIQGSHVIIKTDGKPIPDTTLLEAANLAAYYSKGRSSSNVPVDYCYRKNVRKPKGAKPGMVIYEKYKTLYVTPSEEKMLSIKKI